MSGAVGESEKIDHHYVISPTEVENRDMVSTTFQYFDNMKLNIIL